MAEKPTILLKRYDYIDSLRGLAILLVLLAHINLNGRSLDPTWFYNLTTLYVGPRGVQLFFIVSAFTLSLSFRKRISVEKHSLRNFFIRRFFRIAPLFYLAIIYYLWQGNFWNGNPNHFTLANILSTFLFINGVSPAWINNIVLGGWSVAVEMIFYVSFPLFFYWIKNIKPAIIIVGIAAILMQALRIFLLTLPWAKNPDIQTFTFQFFPSQLPVFLLGILLFRLLTNPISKKDKQFIKISLLVFALLILTDLFAGTKIIAGHYLYSLFFALLLAIFSKIPVKLFVNSITSYIGKVSFSIYLCHVAVYHWLTISGIINFFPNIQFLNFILRFLTLLGISTLFATILFYSVERWGIILGKKIINHFEKVSEVYVSSNAKIW